MRRLVKQEIGKEPEFQNVRWEDHIATCAKCNSVNVAKTATFVYACAEGSPLLMEHLVDVQRPAEKEKARIVKEWAKKAGVFKL